MAYDVRKSRCSASPLEVAGPQCQREFTVRLRIMREAHASDIE